jgi:uncharacterized membrane protein
MLRDVALPAVNDSWAPGPQRMNLDLLPLGWVHLDASLVALGVGAVMLSRAKGTPIHKRRGRIYVAAILLTAATALGIYRTGHVIFAHWLALAVIGVTTLGFLAARLKRPQALWLHVHLTCMVVSCYLLFGGSVNEVFLRVNVLRSFVPNFFHSPVLGMTQLALIVFFAGLIVYFNIAIARRARTARPVDQASGQSMR